MGLQTDSSFVSPADVVIEKRNDSGQSRKELWNVTNTAGNNDSDDPDEFDDGDDGSFGGRGNVILRVECLTAAQTKVLLRLLRLTIVIALAYTLVLFVLKLIKGTTLGSDYFVVVEWVYIVNVCVASICLALLLASVCMLLVRGALAIARRTRKSLRQRIVVIQVCLLMLSIISNVFFLIPSIKALTVNCWFYGTYKQYDFMYVSMAMRWTCWNTVFALFVVEAHDLCPPIQRIARRLAELKERCCCFTVKPTKQEEKTSNLVMNKSWWHHLHIVILWAAFEAMLLTFIIKGLNYRENNKVSNIQEPEIRKAEDMLLNYPTWVNSSSIDWVDITGYIRVPEQGRHLPIYGQVLSYILYSKIENDYPVQDKIGSGIAYVSTFVDAHRKAKVYRMWPLAVLIDYEDTDRDYIIWLLSRWGNYKQEQLLYAVENTFLPEMQLWFTNTTLFEEIVRSQNREAIIKLLDDYYWFDKRNQYNMLQMCSGIISPAQRQQMAFNTTNRFLRSYGLPDCKDNFECNSGVKCSSDPWTIAFNIGSGAMVLIYFVIYIAYLIHANRFLGSMAYNKMRGYHIRWRFQVRMQCIGFAGVFLSLMFLSYVYMETCNSQWSTIMGYAPMELILAVLVSISAYMANPMLVDENGQVVDELGRQAIPQVDAQTFAWTRVEKPLKISKRGYPNEPMFCVELMLKLLYWSGTVYGESAKRTIKGALHMFGLNEYKQIHHQETDTRVLMGWSDKAIVIAFRGTASTKNAITDAKAWITKHTVRSTHSTGYHRFTRVHKGFLSALHAVQDEVLQRVKEHTEEMLQQDPDTRLTIIITGHSLGGALATLASFYIAEMIKFDIPDAADHIVLSCYTFGAPQVGNKFFVSLYNPLVPDTWMVVNDDDAVPKMTNWLGLYSYAGHRVSFNKVGDMIVRPSWVEMNVMKLPGASSAKDHMTGAYAVAMGNAFLAQYDKSKAFHEGLAGLKRLWAMPHVQQILRLWCEVDCTSPDGMTEDRRNQSVLDNGSSCLCCGC